MNHQEISIEQQCATVLCHGNVENSNDFRFLDTYLKRQVSVKLDLSGLDYINSCGFGALVEESMNFSDAGLDLSLKGLKPHIRKTLALLGAEQLLHFTD